MFKILSVITRKVMETIVKGRMLKGENINELVKLCTFWENFYLHVHTRNDKKRMFM